MNQGFFIFEYKIKIAMQNKILSHLEIQHKIRRIAYQIYEANVDETEIVLAGIDGGGLSFAKKLQSVLQDITTATILLCKVSMDKSNPLESGVKTSIPKEEYINKSVVLVDDVLNSGTTLIYGVHHFLKTPLKQLKTAVLVNRNHKKYPVKADYKGISLSTSLQEHVKVEFKSQNNSVYLA
jgi:pyrimidine operon attenuation protein/uracil phosphoribosyltransferase